jgi:hypothetical protein
MTARTAATLRARWALGVLLAVLVALSVLVHHELMAPMAGSAGPMPMATSAPAVTAVPPMAMEEPLVQRAQSRPLAAHDAHAFAAATAATCGGGEGMCTAAAIAAAPLPAALPTATAAVMPPPVCGCVHPLPPGTGPPLPVDTSSVLRI